MSTIASENRNYYNSEYYPCIEKATLAQDVVFTNISPVKGKFFIKVLTPQVNTNSSTENKPRSSNKDTVNDNYVELTIPTYMLFSFMNMSVKYDMATKTNVITTGGKFTIPKGTTFYVEFLGGDPLISKIIIIGLAQ